MGFNLMMMLTSPVTWLLAAMAVSAWRRSHSKLEYGATGNRRRLILRGAALDAAAAFLFLSIAYRPSHAFMAKAKIRQQEDVDEDDEGAPDSSLKSLHRQLRKIRRGEPVDRLIWRLE
jgi:hypothetical protein